MRVGVFDSGLGGFTVLKSLVDHRCFDEIVYFGDTARVPYGSKDRNTVVRYALEALEFFENHDLDLLIVACNTVSVVGLEAMQEMASYPVVGVVEPGVQALAASLPDKQGRVLVLGTASTVRSAAYQHQLAEQGYHHVDACAPALLVSLVEEGLFDGPVMAATLDHYFSGLTRPDAIILACTHFPHIAPAIRRYFGNVLLVHSGEAIVSWLRRRGYLSDTVCDTRVRFYASENAHRVQTLGAQFIAS